MKSDLKLQIIDLLKGLEVYIPNSMSTQHVVRCPYCGDSRNPRSGHFSIHIDINSDTPMLYRCFKCDISGLLNSEVLSELEVFLSPDINQHLKSFNRKLVKTNKYVNNNVNKYYVSKGSDSPINKKKLDYIGSRIGADLTTDDIVGLKIVIDIFEFMKHNEIKDIPNFSFKYLTLINNNYVGFLSTNNNTITFRRFTDSEKLKRYIKVPINPFNLNSNSFYSIPNSIDLLYTKDINIHIAEGIMDIVSVYTNLKDRNKEVDYYYASCGFGYLTIIKFLIYNGINTGLNLHIYSDSDKNDYSHLSYLKRQPGLTSWIDHIYIHRNHSVAEELYGNTIYEKDYGVPSERIIDTYRQIK